MSDVTGNWDLVIATPIGKMAVVLELREVEGRLEGTARGSAEAVPLVDLVREGDSLTWRQGITRPMRLNLDFDVTVDGDALSGTSKAGRLPSSKVTGTRAQAE